MTRGITLLSLFILLFSPILAQTLSLEETLTSLGSTVEFRWDPFFASGTFVNGVREASFVSGRAGETGTLLLDRRDIVLTPLPYLENGRIRFPQTFVNQVRNTLVVHSQEGPSNFRIGAIVIDPGHGGVDPGTVWSYTIDGRTRTIMEKDIVLRVSRMLHSALSASFPDKRVLLTRTGDTNPTLEERTNVANSQTLADNEIAIFISVHANSSLNRNARGFEIFYLDPSHRRDLVDRTTRYAEFEDVIDLMNTLLEEEITQESIILANNILRRMDSAVGDVSPNRGIKAHNWFVVRNALMPSVLVELGFVSHREEAINLTSEAYLNRLSDALYKGISDFIAFFEN